MWGVMRGEREGLKGLGSKNSILMGERSVYFLCLDFIEGFGGWVQKT
jgi:hypothetical protein